MIEDDGFDSLLKHCKELESAGGLANRITPSVVIDLITRLRQAEKDAARYRFIRDSGKFAETGDEFDSVVDEAMNASNN